MCFGLVDLVVWCSDVGVSSADFSLSVSVSSFNGGGAIKWFGVSHVFVIGGGGEILKRISWKPSTPPCLCELSLMLVA